jgi:hypothetical protein
MVTVLIELFVKMFGQLVFWCPYVIDYRSNGFIFFVYFDQGIKLWCHRFNL